MPSQNVCSAKREYCGQCADLEKIINVEYRCRYNCCFVKPSDTCPCKPSHFNKAEKPDIPGELVYSSAHWKIYRQDAGMGEKEYRIFLNDVNFCVCDHRKTADLIMAAVSRGWSEPPRLACLFDLQAFMKGETLFEDIRACSGKSCNFCHRYDVKKREAAHV